MTRPFEEKSLDVKRKILNVALSADDKEVYLLLQDCVMVCNTENLHSKREIKSHTLDPSALHLPCPMLVFSK
jgi:hypothetical protein